MSNLKQNWPQQPVDDLRVDAGYRETFSGQALNAKFAGVLPVGVYRGFDVIAATGLDVTVGSAGVNSALIEVKNPTSTALTASLTAAMPEGMQKTIPVPVGAKCYVVLKVYYRCEYPLAVEYKTAATIEVVSDLTAPDHTAFLVLATINAPSDTTQIAQEHIVNVRNIDLGTDQVASFNALPTGPTNKTYTLAKGSGALAGEFSLFDTETGGFLKVTAIHTKAGKASLSVTANSDSMPVAKLQIIKNGADIELQATIVMDSADEERIYTDFRAFDAHNASSIGWVQSFVESAAGGDLLAAVDTVFISQGEEDTTVAEGLGPIVSGNSGIVSEHNQPLAQRYLGLEAKAKSAATADSAGTAAVSGDTAKVGGLPAAQIGFNTIDHGGVYKNLYPALASDPDLLTRSFAVIQHTKCPTGTEKYYIETIVYGSGDDEKRAQKATKVVNDLAQAGLVASNIFYRWITVSAGDTTASPWESADPARKDKHTEIWIGGEDGTPAPAPALSCVINMGKINSGYTETIDSVLSLKTGKYIVFVRLGDGVSTQLANVIIDISNNDVGPNVPMKDLYFLDNKYSSRGNTSGGYTGATFSSPALVPQYGGGDPIIFHIFVRIISGVIQIVSSASTQPIVPLQIIAVE